MQTLQLAPTVKAPYVSFDPNTGLLQLTGKSIPENAYELYRPLLGWMAAYIDNPAPRTELIFRLSYFNSSSSEYILDLMRLLEKIYLQGAEVRILWFYDHDDEDMEQIGEDFKSMLRVPIIMMIEEKKED